MLSLDTTEGDFDFFGGEAFLCSWCHFTELLCRFLSCGRGCAFTAYFQSTLFKARKNICFKCSFNCQEVTKILAGGVNL